VKDRITIVFSKEHRRNIGRREEEERKKNERREEEGRK